VDLLLEESSKLISDFISFKQLQVFGSPLQCTRHMVPLMRICCFPCGIDLRNFACVCALLLFHFGLRCAVGYASHARLWSTAWPIHRFTVPNVLRTGRVQMATKNNLVTFEAAVGAAASVAFAGYALHTNIVKAQELQDEAKTDKAVAEFPETFKRGRKVQVPLALAATAGGLVGFYLTGNPAFAAGATLAGALHVASGTFGWI
jgi:hypothetical protein